MPSKVRHQNLDHLIAVAASEYSMRPYAISVGNTLMLTKEPHEEGKPMGYRQHAEIKYEADSRNWVLSLL